MLLTICLYISKSQAQQSAYRLHNLSFGPQFSYNLEQKKGLYGGGVAYEFRLNNKWGLTANANFNIGIGEDTKATLLNSKGQYLRNVANNNLSVGASFGYGEDFVPVPIPLSIVE